MKRNSSPHQKCRACDFWTTKADDYCPNCGIKKPGALIIPEIEENFFMLCLWKYPSLDIFISVIVLVFIISTFLLNPLLLVTLGFIGNLLNFYIAHETVLFISFAIVIASLVGFDIYRLVRYLRIKDHSPYSMINHGRLICERISEISQWESKSTNFLNELIRDDDLEPTHGRQILDTLEGAMISRRSQKHQYIVKYREIELIR